MSAKLKWVISYIYNGETQVEKYEFRTIAEIRLMQLESHGMKPTLHENNLLLLNTGNGGQGATTANYVIGRNGE